MTVLFIFKLFNKYISKIDSFCTSRSESHVELVLFVPIPLFKQKNANEQQNKKRQHQTD